MLINGEAAYPPPSICHCKCLAFLLRWQVLEKLHDIIWHFFFLLFLLKFKRSLSLYSIADITIGRVFIVKFMLMPWAYWMLVGKPLEKEKLLVLKFIMLDIFDQMGIVAFISFFLGMKVVSKFVTIISPAVTSHSFLIVKTSLVGCWTFR